MFWVFFKLAIDAQINKIDFTSYNHHIKKLIYICYITSIFKGPILYCKIYFFYATSSQWLNTFQT